MEGPVIKFTDNAHLREYMLWWKERLFLQDWSIHVDLRDEVREAEDGEPVAGLNTFRHTLMSSYISISRQEAEEGEGIPITRICQEKTLVHELLHLKLDWLGAPFSHEGKYYDACEHQNLERMARTLIIVKYNLPLNWFDNSAGCE